MKRVLGFLLCCVLAPAGAGTLSGTVTRADGGAPVENLTIELYPAAEGGFVASDSTTSDASGSFAFDGLAAGDYFLRTFGAQQFDLVNEVFDGVACPGDCNVASGTRISVPASGTATADFDLEQGGAIFGRVTRTEDGSAIADAVIGVRQVVSPDAPFFVTATVTNGDGEYRLSGIPPGDDYIVTSALNLGAGTDLNDVATRELIPEVYDDIHCACPFAAGTRISLAKGSEFEANFAHERSALTVSGTVTGDGAPIEGIVVSALEVDVHEGPPGISVRQGITDASGSYAIRGLIPGNYIVYMENAGEFGFRNETYDDQPLNFNNNNNNTIITVTDQSVAGIDFDLDPAGSISGRVTRSDTNAGVRVLVVALEGDEDSFLSYGSETDPSGNYEITGLSPGTYQVFVFNPSGQNLLGEIYDDIRYIVGHTGGFAEARAGVGTPVVVTDSDNPTDIDFVLDPGGVIRGAVLAEDGGQPLPGLLMELYDDQNTLHRVQFTDINANFAIQGLPTGDYVLVTSRAGAFSKLNEAFDDRKCVGSCLPESGDLISVEEGGVVDLLFELSDYAVLADNVPTALDQVGGSVAVEGSLMAVGMPGDDDEGEDAGAVLLFERVNDEFLLRDKLYAESPEPGQRFGTSVAIEDGILVVGAPGPLTLGKALPKGANAPGKHATVYLMTGQSPTILATLVAQNLSNPETSDFGTSVAIEGGLIAVGAPGAQKEGADDAGPSSAATSGAAIIFRPDPQSSSWTQGAVLTDPTGQPGDGFGMSVSVANGTVAAGVPHQLSPQGLGTGLVQVFGNVDTGGTITDLGKFGSSGGTEGAAFGTSVALSGENMVVGAPGQQVEGVATGASYLFRFDGGSFVQTATLTPVDPRVPGDDGEPTLLGREGGRFGAAVALTPSGLVIGATAEDSSASQSGAAYVFGRGSEETEFSLSDRVVALQPISGSAVGAAVALDGDTLAIGAPQAEQGGVAAGVVLTATRAVDVIYDDGFEN